MLRKGCLQTDILQDQLYAAILWVFVLAQGEDGVDAGAGGETEGAGPVCPGEGSGAAPAHGAAGSGLCDGGEWKADVPVLDDAWGSGEDESAREEERLGMAHAEGFATLEPEEQLGRELGGVDFEVAEERGGE